MAPVRDTTRTVAEWLVRERINRMIAGGFSLRAIYESLAATNAGLPAKRRITMDSLQTHRSRHFPLQAGASAIYRTILEERIAADAVNYENGVMSLVTPRLFLETVVTKGYANLMAESAEVTPEQGLAAARELAKLTVNDDQHQRMADIVAQQSRIVKAMREAVPQRYHQAIMDVLDGRTAPPSGGARLALVEDTADDGGEIDPFGDDADFAADDED